MGITARPRSAVDSNESRAKRPYESATKNLAPSSSAGVQLDWSERVRRYLDETYAVTSAHGHSTVALALRLLISRPFCFSFATDCSALLFRLPNFRCFPRCFSCHSSEESSKNRIIRLPKTKMPPGRDSSVSCDLCGGTVARHGGASFDVIADGESNVCGKSKDG
jgi:hypothetical protein